MSEQLTWAAIRAALQDAPDGTVWALPTRGAVIAGLLDRETATRTEDAAWVLGDPADALAAGIDAERTRVWWPFAGDAQFPWEPHDREQRLIALGGDLLRAIGPGVGDDVITRTPQRWARWWTEFLDHPAAPVDTTFSVADTGQLVAVAGIRTWSMCEHHLLPFTVEATIGYLPTDRVLGLSKFARIVERSCRRLQLQERIGDEVADAVAAFTGVADVGVVLRGRHLCMEARGARVASITTSVAARGRFRVDTALRQELMLLATAEPGAGWLQQRGDSADRGSDVSNEPGREATGDR